VPVAQHTGITVQVSAFVTAHACRRDEAVQDIDTVAVDCNRVHVNNFLAMVKVDIQHKTSRVCVSLFMRLTRIISHTAACLPKDRGASWNLRKGRNITAARVGNAVLQL
jgi:hypothetical protein